MNLDLTIYLTKEGRHYVAHAMPLDVVSSGPTPEAAREAVYEAVQAFLLTAADSGTLEEVLDTVLPELELDQRPWNQSGTSPSRFLTSAGTVI
jgi:predicted RNase H-like HicB family nuclease